MATETIVKHRTSSTPGSVPNTSDLTLGELAINDADGFVFLRRTDSAQSIDEIVRLRASPVLGSGDNFVFNKILVSSAENQLVDSVLATEYRTVKYVIQFTYSGNFQSTELLLLHDGSLVYLTEYAIIQTNMNLGNITAVIESGLVKLLVTPTFPNTTVKGVRAAIKL
jgi:hypothetical protein